MKTAWTARVLCLVVALSIVAISGCAGAFTPERKRRRQMTIRTDIDHMYDDIDWVLGLYRPAQSFDEEMR